MTLARALAADDAILVAPGVWDPLSAHVAAQAGFPLLFLSGSALAFTRLARPDVNLLTLPELVDTAARIAERVPVPLLVDGDSGLGGPAMVARLVRALAQAGAAGVQLEDQLDVKPPDAPTSRPILARGAWLGRLAAALDARPGSDFLVSARTDAALTLGLDEALERAAAAADAGADLLFVEGVRTREDVARMVAALAGLRPLVANIVDGGMLPIGSAAEAAAAGFRIALFPNALVGAAAHALEQAATGLARAGSTAPFRAALHAPPALNALVEAPDYLARLARYAR
jgi:2-methylisocitrate lyase-like PEP mutase family enzyme